MTGLYFDNSLCGVWCVLLCRFVKILALDLGQAPNANTLESAVLQQASRMDSLISAGAAHF